MDFCRNISVSGGLHSDYHQPEQQLLSPSSCSKLDSSLDDLFSGHPLEEGDVNLEWLSIFVEDCLSSTGNVNCLPPAAPTPQAQITNSVAENATQLVKDTAPLVQLRKSVIPGKARSKRRRSQSCVLGGGGGTTTPLMTRRRSSCWSQAHQFFMNNQAQAQDLALTSDPPLLQQAYWLADSELIFPKKEEEEEEFVKDQRGDVGNKQQLGGRKKKKKEEEDGRHGNDDNRNRNSSGGGIRRCSHCLSQRTPQWRGGPLGPKTLCNACGVRYKSGRLLPEYRPAKSPTFVSYIHSNSHKKVLEMRTMSLVSSPSSSSSS